MAGHLIDVFRAKLKRKPQVSAPGMAFIATDYGKIRTVTLHWSMNGGEIDLY